MLQSPVIPDAHFAYDQIAIKVAVALCIGLLTGLEREWAHKETGVRTFSIVSLLGMVSALLPPGFALAAFGGVTVLAAFNNLRTLLANRSTEITTSASLMLTFYLGVLVGRGHLFTPVALAVVMTLLLSLKPELTTFTGTLSNHEIRSAVLVALIGLVIYPLLPDRFVDPWRLVNPHTAWAIVVVLTLIGFGNYVLLRLYGRRGLYVTALLGGAVNSTATSAQLADLLAADEVGSTAQLIPLLLLANVAMFLRNLGFLALFAPAAAAAALLPLIGMAVTSSLLALLNRKRQPVTNQEIPLPSPVSLKSILAFAVLFVAIEVAGTLARRSVGHAGFLSVSFLGGLVSSASATAAAASAAKKSDVTSVIAGTAVVLASVASALVTVPIIFHRIRDKATFLRLSTITVAVAAVGAILLLLKLLHF